MKKNLENFHEILSVSKHSHSEVGFILVISLGPEGVGSFADRKGVGGCWPPAGGGHWPPPNHIAHNEHSRHACTAPSRRMANQAFANVIATTGSIHC